MELARQEWEAGYARMEAARRDRRRYAALTVQLEPVFEELRKRVGQTFTIAELAHAYDGAVEWARDAIDLADAEAPPSPDVTTVTGAAFHLYARGAADYRP